MKQVEKKWIALLCSLAVVLLVATGCSSSQEDTSLPKSSPEENPYTDVEIAVQNWVVANVDELSEQIGSLVTVNFWPARDIASKLIETALLAWLEFSVENVEPLEDIDGCSAKVKLEFPLELPLPLVGKKGYRVSVRYDIIVEDREVTDSDIDLDSFEMRETSD